MDAITDRLNKFEQIPSLGCTCTLRYLSPETHRYTSELLRSLHDDICGANAAQTTIDAIDLILTVSTNSPSIKLYLLYGY